MNNNQQLLKVLVVEDDEDDFILISDYFKNITAWGFEIKWVQRYNDSIHELCNFNHDICFCDYRLGAKNGLDLIKDVLAKNVQTPIILLTGKGNYDIDKEATKAGAFDYLIKAELDEDKLERTIRYTLERINNLQKIQESERRYRSIFEKSKDIVFIAKPDTTITTINYAVTDILDVAVDDCIGKKLTAFLKNPADFDSVINRIQLDGEIENVESEFITSKKEIKTCLISASMEIDSTNKNYLQGIIHDITNLKIAEKANLQSEKLAISGRFIRTLAHEVRNPLSNIQLAVENLLQNNCNEDDRFYLDIIFRNGQRINTLVTELLLSAGPPDLRFAPVSLNHLLENVIQSVNDRLTLRNIKIITEFDGSGCIINADAIKLEIAILNIVVNAIEAVPDYTGQINITTHSKNNQTQLFIRDNGCGISKENKSKLFEPYFTSKRNGIGLGLATTLNILQSHNATIDVHSNCGKGTTFTILFPG